MVAGSSDATNDLGCTEILAAVLRMRFDASARDTLRDWVATRAEIEWQPFYDLVERARLAPLAFYILRDEHLPDPLRNALQAASLASRLRTVVILSELESLLGILESERLPAIVLKGGALAETVYPRPDLRPLGDVDLLVARSDFDRLRELMMRRGYQPLAAETHAGAQEAFENEMVFRKQGRVAVDVDVHWSLFDSPYYQNTIAMDWFWETSRTIFVGAAPARVLGAEAEIIHLCGHLCLHHQGTELLWLHDIAEVVEARKNRIDWATLVERTRSFELILPVRQVLNRVASQWRVDIPPSVLTDLEGLEPSFQEKRVFAWLTATNRPPGKRLWIDVLSLPRWSQRLNFLMSNILPSAEYMRRRYKVRHPALLPFYYPYRWYRGIRGMP